MTFWGISISTRATSRRRPIRASSTTCCSRRSPAWARRCSKFAFDVRVLASAGLRRYRRTIRCQTGRFERDAVQAQSRDGRTDRFAGASAAGLCRRRLAECGDEFSRAHARRQRQPAHDPARSAARAPTRSSRSAKKIVDGLRVDERRIAENLRTYGPFAGTEAVLMEAARAGGDRQELHEVIRESAMRARTKRSARRFEPARAAAGGRRTDRALGRSGRGARTARPERPRRRRAGARAAGSPSRIRDTVDGAA